MAVASQYINALVHALAANDLRTQQPPQAFSYSTFIARLCAGIIGSVGMPGKVNFVVSDLCCLRRFSLIPVDAAVKLNNFRTDEP